MLKTRGEHPKVRTLAPLDPEPLNLDKRIKIQARFQGNSRGSRIGSWVNASGTPEIQRNCQWCGQCLQCAWSMVHGAWGRLNA